MFPKTLTLQNGTRVELEPKMSYMKFNDSISDRSQNSLFKKLKLKRVKHNKRKDDKLTINNSSLGAFVDTGNLSSISYDKLIKEKRIASISPVYYSNKEDINSYFTPLSNVLVLDIEGLVNEKLVDFLLSKSLTINPTRSKYLNGKVLVELKKGVIYDLVSPLNRNKIIRDSFFEKIPLVKPTCWKSNDSMINLQWNLEKIQWHQDFVECKNSAIVSVIDEGCDLNHPDLNFVSSGLNLGTMLPDGSPTGNHGTACAGIASAITDNASGVASVSNTKVLPLAVQTWSDVEIASGINYSAEFGADVISMSFGVYDSWNFWNYNLIDPAIVYANNCNVFMCAATGNENFSTLNRYPSKHPLVLSVGGSNKDDQRKSIGDTSSESWWGASYGLEQYQNSWVGVGVVAPCLEIPTTDILGPSGYSSNDYYNSFNGTSSATPQVAGLAALIKSHYPQASNTSIRQIIEKSAEKVGAYIYSFDYRFPSSSWNQEMGYGRINVRKALKLAADIYGACCDTNCGGDKKKVAFSVQGSKHVSGGPDVQMKFGVVLLNEGSGWANNEFKCPESGCYYFDLNFVKDSYYNGGTLDDVSLYLVKNGTRVSGAAWSGEGAGKRGTGAFSVMLELKKNDVIKVFVHSDGNPTRHVSQYSLTGFNI